MEKYVTGDVIKALREKRKLTQLQLAEQIGVSDKTVSKWETGRGLPDISLLEPIAQSLGISVMELLSGDCVENKNVSGNMRKISLYVCPICGNVIQAVGEAAISCCGVSLPPLQAEDADLSHEISVEPIEDEFFVSVKDHSMEKNHYISFLALGTSDGFHVLKLYPEGAAQGRFLRRGHGTIYAYCNRHGLFSVKV